MIHHHDTICYDTAQIGMTGTDNVADIDMIGRIEHSHFGSRPAMDAAR